MTRRQKTRASQFCIVGAVALLAGAIAALANSGAIQIFGPYPVSENFSDYRFEPSSAVTSTWVHSWMEFSNPASPSPIGLTASWNGTQWSGWVNHGSLQDLFLVTAPNGYPYLVMLDSSYNIYYQAGATADGTSWNSPVFITSSGDYPSLAIATNGTRVIVYTGQSGNQYTCSVVWSPSTQSWSGPYCFSLYIRGRVVAVGNTFYAFVIDNSSHPTLRLDLFQSSDGANWSGPTVLDTYTAGRTSSTNVYCQIKCGYIGYPWMEEAAAASSSLGWVVTYPVSGGSENWIKFCAQGLSGCTTISYTADLFDGGVTTSSKGDLWLSMFTYSTPPWTIPLLQLGIYRAAGGSYLNGQTNGSDSIDPRLWAAYLSGSQQASVRCPGIPSGYYCFSAGDYFRPAMNAYTGATLPFVIGSSAYVNTLMQSFVEDPATGAPPISGLNVGPLVPFGADSRVPFPASETAIHAIVSGPSGLTPVPAH